MNEPSLPRILCAIVAGIIVLFLIELFLFIYVGVEVGQNIQSVLLSNLPLVIAGCVTGWLARKKGVIFGLIVNVISLPSLVTFFYLPEIWFNFIVSSIPLIVGGFIGEKLYWRFNKS